MSTRTPIEIGEWYHCFNRGVDKRIVYEDEKDRQRFLQLLYLANNTDPVRRHELSHISTTEVLNMPRGEQIVAIGAYSLMSNHFHLLLKETQEGGITRFMQKLGTGYTMYFNQKYQRTGNLFMRPFKSKHVHDDRYFQWVVRYIHCNPAELVEPGWKQGRVRDMVALAESLETDRYSSLSGHTRNATVPMQILDKEVFSIYSQVPLLEMLEDARAYYEENKAEL